MTNIFPNRRQVLCGTTALAASLALPALAQSPRRGGQVVMGYAQTPRHLNGAVQSGYATGMPSTQLFASPLRYDERWQPRPYLAESWEMAGDGRSLSLHLRKNAVFHDGQPVTSADVAFSVMAIKANHPFQPMLAPVEGVDTPDQHTAIIRTRTPHPALLLAMSPPLCPIMPKHIYDDGQDLKNHPRNSRDVVGSGPYKLVEFTPAQRVVMERFDDYFLEGRPYLDRVILDLNPNRSLMFLAFENHDIDILPFWDVPTDLVRLQKNESVVITEHGYEGAGTLNWITFNCARAPTSNVLVRRAIATALDRDFITSKLMGGFARPAYGPIAPSSPFYSEEDLQKYPYDLDKAAALLDEAGFPAQGGKARFSVVIDYAPGSETQSKTVAEYVSTQLKKLDIDINVRASADFPSWARRIAEHDFDMTMDVVSNWGDPVIGVARTYLSRNIKPIIYTNNASYANPEADRLLDAAAETMETAGRKALYAEFQSVISKDLPVTFINVVPFFTVASNKIGNLPESIWGVMSPLDEVYLT